MIRRSGGLFELSFCYVIRLGLQRRSREMSGRGLVEPRWAPIELSAYSVDECQTVVLTLATVEQWLSSKTWHLKILINAWGAFPGELRMAFVTWRRPRLLHCLTLSVSPSMGALHSISRWENISVPAPPNEPVEIRTEGGQEAVGERVLN